jgi:6-phosphogluconolactonase
LKVVVADDPAQEAATRIAAALRQAIASSPRASVALSGGDTPWRTLSRFTPADLDWTRIDVFQVDERIVPADHPDRNLRRLREVLAVPAAIHPMPVEAPDLAQAATAYAAALPAVFDLVQLGLGTDGHTASLVPRDAVLAAPVGVAVTRPYSHSAGEPHRRMTLTFPAINRARSILWLVTGAAKREMLAALLAGTADIPANRVARDRAIVIADRAAAG